jgi:large subunit ribosomal protein L30
MLKITLVRSVIGNTPGNRKTVQALGLRKTGRTVYRQDTPSVRGMIRNVAHLLKVENVDSAPEKAKKEKKTVSVISRPEPKAEKPKAAAKPKAEAKPAEKAPAAEAKPAAKKPAAKKPAAEKPAAKKAAPKGRKPDTERKSFGEVGKAKKK